VGLAILAKPIIALIFQHGRFTARYDQTASALIFYTLGLFLGVKVVVGVLRLNDTNIVIGSFIAVVTNFYLSP
jgi:peptidoglycan biosynthesis protein MviN/MurJ (putative lipid II flippase)